MSTRHTLSFESQGVTTRVPGGVTVFEAASWAGIPIDSTCGARGTCGKCRVRLLAGELPVHDADRRFYSEEELADGWRLACRAAIAGPPAALRFHVPALLRDPKAALLGHGRHVILAPSVQKRHLLLPKPTLEDQATDLERLARELSDLELDVGLDLLRSLPAALRRARFDVTAVVCGDVLVAVEAGDTTRESYGIALDIGTTTVVAALMNLGNGMVEALGSRLNGQAPYGADVISRITHAMGGPEALEELRRSVLTTANDLVGDLCATAGVSRARVYQAVVAGNATMMHLLLGVDPRAISVAPFAPAFRDPLDLRASEVGLDIHPEGRVQTFPLAGAYVGADVLAGLLATGLVREEKLRLFVDIGTNGEIVLGSASRVLATAAPAGPAFEGGHIRHGMRATEGAIEGVVLGDRVELQVIGDVEPRGLCGSGLADAVAQLRLTGLLDASGRLAGPERAPGHPLADRLVELDGVKAFRLADGVYLTQRDIRELQFAKSAIATGVRMLTGLLGVDPDDIEEVLLAGSFGTFINPASARVIGLTPPLPLERIASVGNAAAEGAKIALLSFREQQLGFDLASQVEYVELSGRPEFNELFVEALPFPELEAVA